MIMKKILFYISSFVLSVAFIACNSGFNQKEAEEILQKSELSATDYDNLLHMYESALDDAIKDGSRRNVGKRQRGSVADVCYG